MLSVGIMLAPGNAEQEQSDSRQARCHLIELPGAVG